MSQGRVRVKICGLTNLNDALHAWHCGADLLGFISVPSSPRYVSPPRLAEITTALRQADCTALLVSVVAGWTQEDIRALASSCDLDLIQLHGGESPDFVARLNLPTIIAHRVKQSIDWRAIRAYPAWAHLFDTYDPQALGGTGHTWDWTLAQGAEMSLRLIVAGGLTPENVSLVVHTLRPWGVDVSSGVEATPGRKDPDKVARFVAAVREAEADIQ